MKKGFLIVGIIFSVLFVVIFYFTGTQFFQAISTLEMVGWIRTGAFILLIMGIVFIIIGLLFDRD